MANAPHDDAFLQLHVRKSPGGAFSNYVFEQMKERAILRFEGPLGTFYLREDSDQPMVFVAGGTGFAPIKAMIEHCFHNEVGRQMVLYWGARSLKDLYMPQLPDAGRRTTRTSRSSRCCPTRFRAMPGAGAPASSTRRCSTISPICRDTRSMPAGRRR